MNRIQADIQTIISYKDLFEPLRHATVLITGATGLIGSMLIRTLAEAQKAYDLDLKL